MGSYLKPFSTISDQETSLWWIINNRLHLCLERWHPIIPPEGVCCYCWRCSLFSAEKNHRNSFLATLGWVWTIWFSCEFKPNSFTSSASVAPLKSPLMCRQRWESITTHHSPFYSVTLHLCWRCFVSLESTPGHEMLLGHNPEISLN